MKIRVGTRVSELALTQSNWVIDRLKEASPELEVEVIGIKTKGDKILDKPLHEIGDKGLFVTEIENSLLENKIDMAIHSMKDMPTAQPEGLELTYVPKREDPRDVLILRQGLKSLSDVPKGGKIGTGSKRRKFQLLNIRPDLNVMEIRGNVGTRISKIESENLDGIVLAAAGVMRLGLEGVISEYLDPTVFIPAPAQGILALEVRCDDEKIKNVIKKISHEATEKQGLIERQFLESIEGSCHIPVGAYAQFTDQEVTVYGLYGDEDGKRVISDKIIGSVDDIENLGRTLAEQIKKEYNRC